MFSGAGREIGGQFQAAPLQALLFGGEFEIHAVGPSARRNHATGVVAASSTTVDVCWRVHASVARRRLVEATPEVADGGSLRDRAQGQPPADRGAFS
jgi:hypothetical protein